ncbi:lysophospholipid acyltransferase family protein [Aestuariimicrobium sp. T2.26MG-19.2B]|uniref:lysophospholipid acyltransferase family protein n=1 Tax=Aestuariimicrobium sp. T2.26MG-19.2B TaxID=3040679 RepID=UPI0024779F65|nr:lysophospholipid acyltransferase family protein [Aestuariimicrobium sp. T2.26MG-19.2B]CAI9408369.1 Bifunctional protein Aas [Aestuariimicrobium sp. T2.26MG-19.2B]
MTHQPLPPGESNHRLAWPLRRANHEDGGRVFTALGRFVHAAMGLLVTHDWRGSDRLPQTGGVLVVSNHLSYFDAVALGEFLIWSGRWPRYLGKVQLWKTPVVGWLARSCEQIPVDRGSAKAAEVLVTAQGALDDGRCVTMYPEGTLTRDPETWPMTARSGAARLALRSQHPVVPVGQWGANHVIGGTGMGMPRFFPRKRIHVCCGEPIDLSDLRPWVGTEREGEAVRAASVRIMDALTGLVEELRGTPAPRDRWDTRVGARVPQPPARVDEAGSRGPTDPGEV